MKKILLALAVAATCATGPALAQDARLLGVSTLSHREGDIDVVPVSCRPRVAAVKLRTTNAPAEIERVWLTYGNGEREQVRVDETLRRGEETGWIDVSGRRRCIVSVAVEGDAERRGEWRDNRVSYDDRYDRGSYRRVDNERYNGPRRGYRPAEIEIYGRYRY